MAGTERNKLFDDIELEKETRIPKRPLGKLSDFVVEQIPLMIDQVKKSVLPVQELSRSVEQKLTESQENLTTIHGGAEALAMRVARLDLLMVDSAIAHLGGHPPQLLATWVDAYSERMAMIPSLTYEDIVLNNPNTDIRTFTTGKTARSEADFWIGHQRIEYLFEWNISDLNKMLFGEKQLVDDSSVIQTLRTLNEHLRHSTQITAQIGFLMPTEHFSQGFRQFVMSHPLRNYDGPSGAFSARVPILEALIAGENVPQYSRERTQSKLQYFPKNSQKILMRMYTMADEGISLRQLILRSHYSEGIVNSYNRLVASLKNFRLTHFQAVAHQLPEVFAGSAEGSSGETNVPSLLKTRINHNLEI